MEINRIEKTRQKLLREGKKILDLSPVLAEKNMTFPLDILQSGFQEFLLDSHYHPQSKGDLRARKALAEWYAQMDFLISPKHILLTSGTSESYFHLFKMLLNPGDAILLPRPSYPLFEEIARLADVTSLFYTLDEKKHWQINSYDVEKILYKVKAMVVVSPHNPTGSILSESSLQQIADLAQRYSVPIISDEVFCTMMFDGKKFPRMAALHKEVDVFTLNGFSKTYALPGLKLSWIAVSGPSSEKYIQKLEHSIDVFLACNQISQAMVPAIIQNGAAFIADYALYLQKNRDLTIQILDRLSDVEYVTPEAGPYLFVKLKNIEMTDEDFVIALMEKTGIFLHPGYFYDYDQELYVVISYVAEPNLLARSLEKVVAFIEQVRKRNKVAE